MFWSLMRNLFLTILITLAGFCQLTAQDPVLSQYFFSPLQLNPALAGTADGPVFHLNHRNQWPSLSRAYLTTTASYNQLFPQFNSGIGASILSDIAGNGIYVSTQIGLSYAYEVKITDDLYFRAGLEGNFVSKRLNWNKLIFLDQLDVETGAFDANGTLNPSSENRPSENINYFDFGFGGLLHTRYIYGGIALKHINEPKEGFLRGSQNGGELPLRYTVHLGGKIPINAHNKILKQSFINPNILFTKQRQFYQLNIGANYHYDMFFGGLAFRHTFTNSDALIALLGFEKDFFKIAYSYDLTVSKLGVSSGGAHEISLILNFENKNKTKSSRYNNCLQLFR
jgi:type IX secretion system PorP/SprF family membrane protein